MLAMLMDVTVLNVSETFGELDKISYSKRSSIIKDLRHLIVFNLPSKVMIYSNSAKPERCKAYNCKKRISKFFYWP